MTPLIAIWNVWFINLWWNFLIVFSSYAENFNIRRKMGGALFMHILHSKKIEQPIEKLSESFLDLSLNWASVGELKNGDSVG